jgi:hypothetical protein
MLEKRKPFIIGMIHLPPLPGSPNNKMSLDEIVNYAITEGQKLQEAGVDGVIVENLGVGLSLRFHEFVFNLSSSFPLSGSPCRLRER